MQSKGAKKTLRGKLDKIVTDQKRYEKDSPGAINLNYFVLVSDNQGNSKRAIIVECRLDKKIFDQRTLEEVREDPKVNLTEASYEYYIHYEHMNRRLDEWVKYSRITKTDEFVDIKKIKENNKAKGIHYSSDEEYIGLEKDAR